MASIKHFRGDTFLRSWILKDSDGVPIPLDGATARLHLRDSKGELITEATTENGSIIINSEFGRIDLRIEAVNMNIPMDSYVFDIELTRENGIVKTLELGRISIIEDITHD